MATQLAQAQGFSLPGIDYTMTKPMDMVGAIRGGINFGQELKTLPGQNRALQIQKKQQDAVLGGSMPMETAVVGPDGGIRGDYMDPRMAELRASMYGYKMNHLSNMDAVAQGRLGIMGDNNALGNARLNEAVRQHGVAEGLPKNMGSNGIYYPPGTSHNGGSPETATNPELPADAPSDEELNRRAGLSADQQQKEKPIFVKGFDE